MPLPARKRRKLRNHSASSESDEWSGFPAEQDLENITSKDEENTQEEDLNISIGNEADERNGVNDIAINGEAAEVSGSNDESEAELMSEDKNGDNLEEKVHIGKEQIKVQDKKAHGAVYSALGESKVAQNGHIPKKSISKGPEKRSNKDLHPTGNPRSNLLKLQIEELLEQIRPQSGEKEEAAESALRFLKTTIENIPDRDPLPILKAEEEMMQLYNVKIPFPDPRPAQDAQYKLQYKKPAKINVVGSYSLKTRSTLDNIVIDLVVVMPSSLFQEKDYLDHRYFYRRAYYTAQLAAGIQRANRKGNLATRFRHFHGNKLLPIIIVEPKKDTDASQDSKPSFSIQIIPAASDSIFPMSKTIPNKNCVRNDIRSTPFYNASLRSDLTMLSFLKLVHSASVKSTSFKDACLLGRIWLRQRGFGSSMSAGGFGHFEWTVVMAMLLQDDLPRGVTKLSAGFDSFQMFKAALQFLASRDLNKQPLWFQTQGGIKQDYKDGPMFFDGIRGINILYKMTAWSYRVFRHEVLTSIKMFGQARCDPFEAAFIIKTDIPLLRYDALLKLTGGSYEFERLCSVLSRGLGDRVFLIQADMLSGSDHILSWALDDLPLKSGLKSGTLIGLLFNTSNIHRLVDHGPLAEDPDESARFRQFWGDKAELRRFKDGSIRESLLWSSTSNSSIPKQIIKHVLHRHMGIEMAQDMIFYSTESGFMASRDEQSGTNLFQPIMTAFEVLEKDVRGLDGLPLVVRQIAATDSQLRFTSIDPPLQSSSEPMTSPSNIIIQFEGSGRWPDDLLAIQRVKIAFLLKLSSLVTTAQPTLTTRLGLENEDHPHRNRAFLDIIYPTGASFRLRIHHDREAHLLSTALRSPQHLTQRDQKALSAALATYRRTFLRLPAHTRALQTACSRFPALSPAIRLTKRWFAAHLLTPHFADPLIELLVAHVFLHPWPWQAPGSAATGFLRTLFFLARWDWRSVPLLVDFSAADDGQSDGTGVGGSGAENAGGSGSGSGNSDERPAAAAVTTRFDAWRAIDPALNRVVLFVASNAGAGSEDGTEWTEFRPGKVVAARMTALARAAAELVVREEGVGLRPERLFARAMGEYDFVVWMREEATLVGRRRKKVARGFKNLEVQRKVDVDAVGFDPVGAFLRELEDVYGDAVVFFHDGYKGDVIAGLWSPRTARRKWKNHLDFSTIPVAGPSEEMEEVDVNKDAILAEIARLGGDMIEKIEVNKK